MLSRGARADHHSLEEQEQTHALKRSRSRHSLSEEHEQTTTIWRSRADNHSHSLEERGHTDGDWRATEDEKPGDNYS